MNAISGVTYEEFLDGIKFRETQKFRQPLLWVFLGAISLISILVAALQAGAGVNVGNNPAPGIVLLMVVLIFGISLPLFFIFLHSPWK
jgi:hypothetical protein